MSSTRRVIGILELLARRSPLGVREVARTLDIPVTSAHRILQELEETEAVEKLEGDQGFELSYRLFHLVALHMERMSLPRIARPFLERLAYQTQETVFLAVPSRWDVVYLEKMQSDQQLQLHVELGTRRPMHCTGLGKVILGHLPPAQQEQFLASGPFQAYTPYTITDPGQMSAELAQIRARGYAEDNEEILRGVQCIAAPLFNAQERVIAAISVSGQKERFGSDRYSMLLSEVLNTADALSRKLGARREART